MAHLAQIIRRSFRRKSTIAENIPETPASKDVSGHGNQHIPMMSGGQCFFEYLVVVSLKKNVLGEYAPQITYQFPKSENLMSYQKEEEERLLKAIPLFCFPDGNNWASLNDYTSETFSFVLTNIDSSRKFGYCRRLLPAGKVIRLPEVYCIISCLGCFGLFAKILDEVEKRRQIATAVVYPFMQGLREASFPAPGKTVQIKSFIPESGTEIIELTRPLDSRLEHIDFKTLVQCLSSKDILQVFASAVLERRIVFFANDLSILSQSIHAVAALLFPFTWEHTYIPVLPKVLLDTVCCPTPFMVGIQNQFLDFVLEQPMEEVLLVNLGNGKIIKTVGDEDDILPTKLQEQMLTSLMTHQSTAQTSEEFNKAVSDTFMNFFVKTMGHYLSHFKELKRGTRIFQEKSFLRAVQSKSTRRFLKRFLKTQMFSLLIQTAEKDTAVQEGYFQQKAQKFYEQNKSAKK